MRIALLLIMATLVAACSTSGGSQKKSELRSGADIGKTVTQRTQEAQQNDATHVIIATSEDGAPADSGVDKAPADAKPASSPAPITLRIDVDGKMVDESGKTLDAPPAPAEGATLHLRYPARTPTETVAQTLKALEGAGWTDLVLKIEDDSEEEANPREAKGDQAGVDAKAESGSKAGE